MRPKDDVLNPLLRIPARALVRGRIIGSFDPVRRRMCSHAAVPFGRRRDLAIARLRRDDTRAGEIETDRTSFHREMMRIVIKERSARTRLRLLHGDEGFPHRPFRTGSLDERDSAPFKELVRLHSDVS